MSAQSSGSTPRISTSSDPSSLGSYDAQREANSRPSSKLLGSSNAVLDYGASPHIEEHLWNDGANTGGTTNGVAQYKRQRPTSSGGFLLQTTSALDSHDDTPRLAAEGHRDTKGKKKLEDGNIVIPKRPNARHRHRLKPSLGRSPLALEVSSSDSKDAQGRIGVKDLDGQDSLSGTAADNNQGENGFLASDAPGSRRRSAIGHDTDPAQIVHLALNLSESRRRVASTGGLMVPRDASGSKRIISSGQTVLGSTHLTGGEILRQNLQQQRRASRNLSPRSGKSGGSAQVTEAPTFQPEKEGKSRSTAIPDLDVELTDGGAFNASDATFARAERARETFELLYEYRRLLPNLVPIPTNSTSRPPTHNFRSKATTEDPQNTGRAYNPLQYIRNRRVRFRERNPLDAEADGWKDLERVRLWVDNVRKEREAEDTRINNAPTLPLFNYLQSDHAVLDTMHAPKDKPTKNPESRKPTRPRMDWTFTPWDLLADANWLGQDANIKQIEDRDGNRMAFHRVAPKNDPVGANVHAAKLHLRKSESLSRLNVSPDRLRTLLTSARNSSKERSRRSLEVNEPRTSLDIDGSFRGRKSGWSKKFVRSRSPSSSEDSECARQKIGRRGKGHVSSQDHYDNAALEKHMMDMIAKEAENQPVVVNESANLDQQPKVDQSSKSPSKRTALMNGRARQRPKTPQRMQTDFQIMENGQTSARASLDELRLEHHRMSSDEFGSTAPSSPTTSGFIPSIAINLSPPARPRVSAVSPQKTLPMRLNALKRGRSRSVERRAVSENDLVKPSDSTTISRQVTNEPYFANRLDTERTAESSNGFLSPTKSNISNKSKSLEANSFKSTRHGHVNDSRLRGLFKGGRIAELAGIQVSKVGEMIWKKDVPSNESAIASPASSAALSEDSDLDDGDVSGLDNSPPDHGSQGRTIDDEAGKLSRVSTNSGKPKYYMTNLPTFRSPFSKEDDNLRPSNALLSHDHITRQQLDQRQRTRSSRFDRLAPPKMDMRSVSPSPSPSGSRYQSQERRTDDSRDSSSNRSDRHVLMADKRLNDALGIPGRVPRIAGKTGLAQLSVQGDQSGGRPHLENKRQWSISDRGVSAVRGTITKRDIARTRALLLSSGIKANEISRRGESVPEQPPALLRNLQDIIKGPIPQVPRKEQHVFAARMLVSEIESSTKSLRNTAETFLHDTAEDLHLQIKAIDDDVTHKLTPAVRASADDADAFSTELTTTHTLAVKQLNDSVDVILRRRRRRLRWMRRGGWAMLEWALLGVMWIVWFIVVVVRLVRGTIRGFVVGVRWMLWL